MANDELIKVDGLQYLDKALAELSLKMQKSYVTSGLKAAAKPVVAAAKKGASNSVHPSSGALAESIGVKASKRGGVNTSVWIGAMRNNKQALQTYFSFYYAGTEVPLSRLANGIRHGHLIELGTKNGVQKRPFLRPALDSQKTVAVSEFKKAVKKRLDSKATQIYKAQQKGEK